MLDQVTSPVMLEVRKRLRVATLHIIVIVQCGARLWDFKQARG